MDGTHVYQVWGPVSGRAPVESTPAELRRVALDGSEDVLLDADARVHSVALTGTHVAYWGGPGSKPPPLDGFHPLVLRRIPKAGGEPQELAISPYGGQCTLMAFGSTLYGAISGLPQGESFGGGVVTLSDSESAPTTLVWSEGADYPPTVGDDTHAYVLMFNDLDSTVMRLRRDGSEPTVLHQGAYPTGIHLTEHWVLWDWMPTDPDAPPFANVSGVPRKPE